MTTLSTFLLDCRAAISAPFERVQSRFQRSARFVIVGGINTAVGLAAFPLLLWLHPAMRRHYVLALMTAQAACLCFAYVSYKVGVFRTRGRYLAEFFRFASFYLINYTLNWAALPLMVEVFHFEPILAQFGFTISVIVGSYFWHNRITFNSASEAHPRMGRVDQFEAESKRSERDD